ncbi:MAG: ABC transporter permease [Epsilonproteobacteria bacterium]|nr:MAG: ABC transporter permease [Campylobacterota bacterium]RLA67792.1 MAG: ABC transporter permease [Campylobacterota bacterium]
MIKYRGLSLGLFIIFIFVLLAIFAPIISSHDPSSIYTDFLRISPFQEKGFLLGTDDLGRDILSRLLFGSRISLLVGASVVAISLTCGTTLGLLSGYFRGTVDTIIMGVIDVLMSFPSILLAILVISILGPGLNNAMMAVAIVGIPNFTRIVRSSVMVEKNKDYHLAAVSSGASSGRIIFKEIFPNILAPLIVQATLGFSEAILSVAALGFLGLGAQPPLPEWGIMLSDARPFIESNPSMVTLPGLCIFFVLLGFNLMGDGLRDYFDPKLKRR